MKLFKYYFISLSYRCTVEQDPFMWLSSDPTVGARMCALTPFSAASCVIAGFPNPRTMQIFVKTLTGTSRGAHGLRFVDSMPECATLLRWKFRTAG